MTWTEVTVPIFEPAAAAASRPAFTAATSPVKKSGDKAGADFVPAGHADVSRLERCVRGFDERDETFGFDDADCLLGHGGKKLRVGG